MMSPSEGEVLIRHEQQHDSRCLSCVKLVCSRQFLLALFLGQFISLLLCGTGVTTGILQQHGINIPTAQSFLNYVLLCLVFTTILVCRSEGRTFPEILRQWGWKYFLIAVIDVEANYLVVKAYQYTTVTSVQLLDCFSIISVMVLSYFCLKARYKLQHIGGAGVCLVGMVGLVLTDILVDKNDNQASNIALGDVLIIIGATFYGVSNVCEEYVVRTYDKVEFLAMLGLFGSFINGAQFAILERNEIASLDLSSPSVVISLVIFVICQFLLYATMTVVIQLTSATVVNMSILSADFYTLLFGLFLFNYKFHVLYFVAFSVIIIGIGVYSLTPNIPNDNMAEDDSSVSDSQQKKSAINNDSSLEQSTINSYNSAS